MTDMEVFNELRELTARLHTLQRSLGVDGAEILLPASVYDALSRGAADVLRFYRKPSKLPDATFNGITIRRGE